MPLIVFLLGLALLPFVDRLKKNKQLKMLELYFNELITLLNQHVEKQIKEIKKCISDIDNYDQNYFTLTQISGSSVDYLNKINNEDLFKIYISRRKNKYKDRVTDFMNLNEIINYFQKALPHLFQSNEKAINLYDNYRQEWNQSQNAIVDIYNDFITYNNSRGIIKGQDAFVDKLCSIFDAFFNKYGIDLMNIKLGFEEFINPLIEFAKENSNDQRSYYLLGVLQKARHSYKEMITVRDDHKEFLTTTVQNMTTCNEKLSLLMEKLKNQKLKFL